MVQKLKFVLMLLMGFLVACATPTASNPAAPSSTLNSPIAGAPAPANAPAGTPIIEIERSGGIAGKTIRTAVFATGEVKTNDTTSAQLGADAAQKLVADLDAAGFFTLQGSYKSRCNDCFQYRITVVGPAQTKTVSYVQDGQLPDPLTKVVEVLAASKALSQ